MIKNKMFKKENSLLVLRCSKEVNDTWQLRKKVPRKSEYKLF